MDYYEILGVQPDASTQEIKKAFRQIARECHPDVTGDDPVAAERFKAARKAYETLVDPVTRSRYDRRGQRRQFARGSFFDAFYRQTGEAAAETGAQRPKGGPSYGAHDAGGHASSRRARRDPRNDLDLDDLFGGLGGAPPPPAGPGPTPRSGDFGFGDRPRGPGGHVHEAPPRDEAPARGDDVRIDLDVPVAVARRGGTVTALYHRLVRPTSRRPGVADDDLVRVQDIADVRILPGARDGDVLCEKGLGDAGEYGGPHGDLYVRLRIADAPRARPGGGDASDAPTAEAEAETVVLDIGVTDALLGGRVELDTPAGRVRLTLPPCTSSGARLRLKGKGRDGADLFAVVRIVCPAALDDDARALVEELARRLK